jgi:hypothetical protein
MTGLVWMVGCAVAGRWVGSLLGWLLGWAELEDGLGLSWMLGRGWAGP